MPTLPETRLAALLAPYLSDAPTPPNLLPQLSTYLDLLLRWNERTNLTAIREPEEIVRRHFGESLFAGLHLAPLLSPSDVSSRPESRNDEAERPAAPARPPTLLDFGSGAGFPGLPIQLLLPGLRVTLAESQGKKASFLREAVRTLGLPAEVWGGRVEDLPASHQFDAVAMRAVDRMEQALAAARLRVAPGGWLAILATGPAPPQTLSFAVPDSTAGRLTLQQAVPQA
jgi:16S rRNA (guanine527-N7)-methyltransferase